MCLQSIQSPSFPNVSEGSAAGYRLESRLAFGNAKPSAAKKAPDWCALYAGNSGLGESTFFGASHRESYTLTTFPVGHNVPVRYQSPVLHRSRLSASALMTGADRAPRIDEVISRAARRLGDL